MAYLHAIIFDAVRLNIGDAYNSSTGDFTAPYPGLYLFIATIASGDVNDLDEVHYLLKEELCS